MRVSGRLRPALGLPSAFLGAFGLDSLEDETQDAQQTGFIAEAEALAEQLVGRQTESETLTGWIEGLQPWLKRPRVGWLGAGPGFGKSMLMAHVATHFIEQVAKNSAQRGLYLHRFRGGDARNNRRAFLLGLTDALLLECLFFLGAISPTHTRRQCFRPCR